MNKPDQTGPAPGTPEPQACSRCGSTRLVPGTVGGGESVLFKPSKIKQFITLKGRVDVAATACLNCGTVEMRVDPREVIDIIGGPDASGGRGAT